MPCAPVASPGTPTPDDLDGDGIPNTWEEQFHHDPNNFDDCESDFDHDGLTAYQEYELWSATNGASGNPLGKWQWAEIPVPSELSGCWFYPIKINNHGEILAGGGSYTSSDYFVYLVKPNGDWIKIEPATGPGGMNYFANDLNDGGTVIGSAMSADGLSSEPFIWDPAGGYRRFVHDGLDAYAWKINNHGDWVGTLVDPITSESYPAYVVDGDNQHDSGDWWPYLQYLDINDFGEAMGTFGGTWPPHAFLAMGAWKFDTGMPCSPPVFSEYTMSWWGGGVMNNIGEFTSVGSWWADGRDYRSAWFFNGEFQAMSVADHLLTEFATESINDSGLIGGYVDNYDMEWWDVYLYRDEVSVLLTDILPDLGRCITFQNNDSDQFVTIQSASGTPVLVEADQDQDNDGMPDDWELYRGHDPSVADGNLDSDGDGLSNYLEFIFRDYRPNDYRDGIDNDIDGMPNPWEFLHGLDPSDFTDSLDDPDQDGLTNLQEFKLHLNPNKADTDGDGVSDGDEILANFTNPLSNIDTDSDGLPNDFEKHFSRQLLNVSDNPEHWGEWHNGILNGNLSSDHDYTGDGITAAQFQQVCARGLSGKAPADGYWLEPQYRTNKIPNAIWIPDPFTCSGSYVESIPGDFDQLTDLNDKSQFSPEYLISHIGAKTWGQGSNPERVEWNPSMMCYYSTSAAGFRETSIIGTAGILYQGHIEQSRFKIIAMRADHEPFRLDFLKYRETRGFWGALEPEPEVDSSEIGTIAIAKGALMSDWFEIKAPMGDGCDMFEQMVPFQVSIDSDRDGDIADEPPTSAAQPFRFWINNDSDGDEVDEPPVANVPDSSGDFLTTCRDLEDFCRIKVTTGFPLADLISGHVRIALKFQNVTEGNPSIRVWKNESDSGERKYLTNGGSAGKQIALSPYLGSSQFCCEIPGTHWNRTASGEAHLIFEGVEKGKGELVVVALDEHGETIGESKGIFMHLMDVREMYERAKIVHEAGQIPDPWVNENPPPETWEWYPDGNEYVEDPQAEPITCVYVHGWRMDLGEAFRWADTSYKRLWHQGFKGRFYAFRWATYSGENSMAGGYLTYNLSEYRAWRCGPALANFVNQLPGAPAEKRLFAHSMGNVISGVALRSGMLIGKYALCNAAMSASAYDTNPALRKDQHGNTLENIPSFAVSPDTDSDPVIRDTYGLQGKFNQDSFPRMFSFGLPLDSALGKWTLNNSINKPDALTGYSYIPWNSIKLLHEGPRAVTKLEEAMGHVTKSLTHTAGADLRTNGGIVTGFHDMSSWSKVGSDHSGFGDEHSAEWLWNYQSTNLFWKRLYEVLELEE